LDVARLPQFIYLGISNSVGGGINCNKNKVVVGL